MVKVFLMLLMHGINPMATTDEKQARKLRRRLSEREKQMIINNCKTEDAKNFFRFILF